MSIRDTLHVPPPQPSPEREKQACLIIISGVPMGKVFILDRKNTIGRDAKCSVHLEDLTISHEHASVNYTSEGWTLKDLSSQNGTYVNFEAISQKKLLGTEHISLGHTTLKFMVADEIEKNFYQKIFEISSQDPLTHVLSKGMFTEAVTNEVGRARRYGKSLSFCMTDLDDFKKCNDEFGHLAGDYILKEWSSLIQNSIRTSDFMGRLGGEEFGILITEQDLQQAEQVVQRLISLTQNHIFKWNQNTIPVTFSAGLSTMNPSIKDAEGLFKLADEKLYLAKAAGRNCYRS